MFLRTPCVQGGEGEGRHAYVRNPSSVSKSYNDVGQPVGRPAKHHLLYWYPAFMFTFVLTLKIKIEVCYCYCFLQLVCLAEIFRGFRVVTEVMKWETGLG